MKAIFPTMLGKLCFITVSLHSKKLLVTLLVMNTVLAYNLNVTLIVQLLDMDILPF